MASIVNIPFNFQPVNAGNIANASYTVPAGKYARITVTLSTNIYPGAAPISTYTPGISTNSNSTVAQFWLKSGDAVTVTQTPGTTSSASSASNWNTRIATSIATLSINGTIVTRSSSNCCFFYWTGTTAVGGITGEANINYRYEEFNNIS